MAKTLNPSEERLAYIKKSQKRYQALQAIASRVAEQEGARVDKNQYDVSRSHIPLDVLIKENPWKDPENEEVYGM